MPIEVSICEWGKNGAKNYRKLTRTMPITVETLCGKSLPAAKFTRTYANLKSTTSHDEYGRVSG